MHSLTVYSWWKRQKRYGYGNTNDERLFNPAPDDDDDALSLESSLSTGLLTSAICISLNSWYIFLLRCTKSQIIPANKLKAELPNEPGPLSGINKMFYRFFQSLILIVKFWNKLLNNYPTTKRKLYGFLRNPSRHLFWICGNMYIVQIRCMYRKWIWKNSLKQIKIWMKIVWAKFLCGITFLV